MILVGDTNCDLSQHNKEQPLDNNNTKHMCNIYKLFSFKQLINNPTRVTLSSLTIIDHVATTATNNIVQSGVFKTYMSDHFKVFCVRKFRGAQEKNHKVLQARSMNKFNEQAFLADVASIFWDQIASQCTEIDLVEQEWSNAFSSIIEKHAPMKTIRVSEKYCPWVNADLKRTIRSRDKLKKKAIKTRSPLLLSSYKHLRNQVNRFNID